MKVIANRNTCDKNDRFGENLLRNAKGHNVDIAVAFFTNYKFIEELLNSGSTIRLIVRLNIGTSPYALNQILYKPNICIRFFTSERFHPKLYIVKHDSAFAGSSNLTDNAFSTNNEINFSFDYEDDSEVYSELALLFENYWSEAQVLDQKTLDFFYEKTKTIKNCTHIPEIYAKLGETHPTNTLSLVKKDKKRDFIDSFKREYQTYISAFNKLVSYYNSTPERKWIDIPLRIEIDRFLWWIRECKCPGPDGWRRQNSLSEDEIKGIVLACKAEYLAYKSEYLESIAHNYRVVEDGFQTQLSIKDMDEEILFNTLNNVHSFHDLLRFHNGGTKGLRRDFFNENSMDQIKKTLIYLIYGKDEYDIRIYNCIFSSDYKLECFGESCVKELYGYMNKDGIPICNGRTIKSLEWLGFGKL